MISTFAAIFTLLFWACVAWVYWDATANKIGKIPGEKGFSNMSAGLWSFGTLMLWAFCFPYYLIKRQSLIERAQTHPVEVRRRWLKLGVICFFGVTGANHAFNDKQLDVMYATLGQGRQHIPAIQIPAVEPPAAHAASMSRPAETAAAIASTSTKAQEEPPALRVAAIPQSAAPVVASQNTTGTAPSPLKKTGTVRRAPDKSDNLVEASLQIQAPARHCTYKPVMTDEDVANCR